MITKDLGIATAYGYALSKGYTGTEEQFAELMASYASTAQTAVEAAERAVAAQGAAELAQGKAEDAQGVAEGKATEASGSADSASADALKAEGFAVGQQNGTDVGSDSPYYHANAKYYKEQAAGSATTASTKAGEAAQSATDASNAKTAAQTAQGKAEDAQTAAETAQGKAEDAQEAAEQAAEQAEQTLNSYAHVDGYYEQMTVGNAEQLVSTVGVEDKVPYLFRTSGGSADIGNRENDMIVGGTVAWNQRVQNPTAWQYSTKAFPSGMPFVAGHKMLAIFKGNKVDSEGDQPQLYYYAQVSSNDVEQRRLRQTFGENIISLNKTITANGNVNVDGAVWLYIDKMSNAANLIINFIDLTQMFGSTIADYIYSLETATPGAGVAYFRKLFPKPYYAYNAGELMSVQTSAHKLVGFNILPTDLVWKKGWSSGTYVDRNAHYISTDSVMRVVPGMTYCFYMPSITNLATVLYVVYFDANKTYIKNSSAIGVYTTNKFATFTIPDGVYYISVELYRDTEYTGNEGNGVCINLSWDGERDGEYEPYTAHTYALDSDLELRGIPKLDANNALYYDGDTYESDGTVTRRFAIVDLGTLNWTKYETTGRITFNTNDISPKAKVEGVMSAKYIYKTSTFISTQDQKTFEFFGGPQLSICDNDYEESTAAQFKTAMSGVYLVYELATPTTETADPYQNPQIVDDFGTEEYVDAAATAQTNPRDVAIPVGHVTEYQNNLRAKLEMSPESPSGDGDYIVRQTNGQNAYVPLSFPADELPAAPTTDGNYRLKCVVSGGTATFSWEEIV